ncbi:hypothetical protein GUITHDRAFT_154203 [Guillardia theta CCMP2712]|uniref:Uncharacterized protein n=1 Tax=Guillardia theta (strain CCMP2712) TaxID=905079 RepID=L1IWK1_GUITC|nr:hypothetical protein GUITHDRAFT_154203 [Guillardia theta CCMP2712]EKX40249.1 hypothetical protein GUITHDRAFT_154203 [Guillardia theta CCMP2712]|eukprot:XP_005827229.1 hypothetical protein GUITHDRAFT_154203 [Guillardia theta CCMP2712]
MPTPLIVISPEEAGGATRSTLLEAAEELKRRGKSVAGVVAPTKDDRRHLIRISSSETRLLQLNEISEETKEKMKAFKKDMKGEMEFHSDQEGATSTYGESTVAVGPFIFDEAVFKWARQELDESVRVDYLIIDEIGPLEIKRKQGLEPSFSQALSNLCSPDTSQRVLIVARKNVWPVLSELYEVEYTTLQQVVAASVTK